MRNIIREKRNRKEKLKRVVKLFVLLALISTSFFLLIYMSLLRHEFLTKETFVLDDKVLDVPYGVDANSLDDADVHVKYMVGYADGTFRPNNFVSRAETAFLLSSLSSEYDVNLKYDNSINDLESYHQYEIDFNEISNRICFCVELGLFELDNKNFYPDELITRKEFLNLIAKLKKHQEIAFQYDGSFSKGQWYDLYTKVIQTEDMVDDSNIYSYDSTINDYISRAQVCSIINRTFNRNMIDLESVNCLLRSKNLYGDVKNTDWFFLDVVEASYSHVNSALHKEYQSVMHNDLPKNAYIDLECILQYPELPTGCEVTALAQLFRYYGFDVSKVDLADKYLSKKFIGKSDFVNEFVGNPRSNNGYGCYSNAIVKTAERYLLDAGYNNESVSKVMAYNVTGAGIDELYYLVSNGIPVNVWVTSYMVASNKVYLWGYEDKYIYWTMNEHCVTLIGYDLDKSVVYVADPLVGVTSYDMALFEYRYQELGKQAVILLSDDKQIGKFDVNSYSQEVEEISFANGISNMKLNDVYELKVIVEPAYMQNVQLDWESADINIISVSKGILSANGVGKTNIIASYGDEKKKIIQIEVEE